MYKSKYKEWIIIPKEFTACIDKKDPLKVVFTVEGGNTYSFVHKDIESVEYTMNTLPYIIEKVGIALRDLVVLENQVLELRGGFFHYPLTGALKQPKRCMDKIRDMYKEIGMDRAYRDVWGSDIQRRRLNENI